MLKKTYDFTDIAVRDLLEKVDEYQAIEGNDIADILFEFRVFETEVIKGLQERFYKRYPYNYRSKMAESLDVSVRKISRFIKKK